MLSTSLACLRPPGQGRDLGTCGRLFFCGLSSLPSLPQRLGCGTHVKESLFWDVSGFHVHVALLETSRGTDTGKTASVPSLEAYGLKAGCTKIFLIRGRPR